MLFNRVQRHWKKLGLGVPLRALWLYAIANGMRIGSCLGQCLHTFINILCGKVKRTFHGSFQFNSNRPTHSAKVGTLLQNLMLLQSPILLQLVQLWSVLSHLGTRQSGNNLPEIPYLEAC